MPSKTIERICSLGHKYPSYKNMRLRCPYCNNKKLLKGFNDLKTKRPDLVLDWGNNNKKSVKDITITSDYEAEWICHKCKHCWVTAVRNRSNNNNCVSCEDKNSGKENSFHSNRENFKKLWSEKLNGELPVYLPKSSLSIYWFTCGQFDHEYQATVKSTFKTKFNCQVCSGNVFKVGVNDAESLYPELISKWSSRNDLKLSEVNPKSTKEYLWVCQENHESFKTVPRVLSKPNCKYCLKKDIELEDSILSTHPELAKNWSSLNSKKSSEISSGSGYTAVWNCTEEDHSFKRIVHRYISSNNSCPICKGHKLLKGFNDVSTVWPQLNDLLSERNENQNILSEITFKFSTKLYWTCKRGHETYCSAYQRANFSCGKCTSSKGEDELNDFVNSLKLDSIQGCKTLINPFEIDIYIPKLNIALEFNGDYWHSDEIVAGKSRFKTAEEYHSYKKLLCREKNIDLYFIWESDWIDNQSEVKSSLKRLLEGNKSDPILEKLSNS